MEMAGEPVVRKRGRPKKAKINDDREAANKRQKIGTWPHASGIGIPGGEKTLLPGGSTVEKKREEINNSHGHPQDKFHQQSMRNLAVMNSKRNAIPSGGGKDESPASRNDDASNTTGKDIFSEEATKVVLQVMHEIPRQADGGAAIFPGEAGGQEVVGSGDATALCAICRQPEIKRQTIICDGCEQSFHVSCAGLTSERANGLDDWTCPSCTISFNASGTRSFSRIAQQYLDKELIGKAVAVSKGVVQKGRGKKPENAHEEHQRGLDLNVPPDAHDGLDPTLNQNGLADQNFRQQPSDALQQNEVKAIGSQFSTVIPMDVVSGSVHNQVGRASEITMRQFSLLENDTELKLVEINGELPESKVSLEKLTGPSGGNFLSKNREAVADAVIERKVSPDKLTIVSKELGSKVAARKDSHIVNDLASFSGIKASEISGLAPVQANESRVLDPTSKFPGGIESWTFPVSNSVSRPQDTTERHTKAIDNRSSAPVNISARSNARNLLDNTLQKSSLGGYIGPFSFRQSEGPSFNLPPQIVGGELPDITFEYSKGRESKPLTALLRERMVRSPESVVASPQPTAPQLTARGQALPSMGSVSSGLVNHVDLSGELPTALDWKQQPVGVHYVDLTGVVHDSLHGQQNDSKALLDEELQLKKMGEETLQQLKDFINEKHGLFLAEGWEVEVRKRKNERHVDKYFISPEKQRFRSRLEVMRHLGLSEGPKRKSEHHQDYPKEWSSMVQKVAKGKEELQLPFKCGDLVIESLGVVDVRPGFRDELQIWPVGYRCTWHDSLTASFCISEVVDSGAWAPSFRVTRKFCPTHFGSSIEAVGASGPSSKAHLHAAAGNGTGGMSKVQMDEFLSRPMFSGFKTHFSSVSDREDRESLNALLGGLGGLTEEPERPEWDSSQARDVIGAFTVVGTSTSHAWKLFALEFVQRCRRTPWVLDLLPDICPHFKLEGLSSQPGASGNPESEFPVLLERLGEDRFGLSETLVKGMIEALPNADSCMGYKSLEQRGLCWKEDDSATKPTPQSRFRIRDKARKHRKAADVVIEEQKEQKEQNGVVEHVALDLVKEEFFAPVVPPVVVPQRPPPPAGEPLGKKLPPELVGDVLQIWEFLCRFAEVIGRAQPPLLEDLEEGLICGAATERIVVVQSDSSHANLDEKGGSIKPEVDTGPVLSDNADVLAAILGKFSSDRGVCAESPTNLPPSSQPNGSLLSQDSQQSAKNGVQEINEQDERKSATGNLHSPASPGDGSKPEQVKGEVLNGDGEKTQVAKPLISSGFSTAGSIHIPLMNYLLSDLQSKVCGPDEVPGENEESKPLKRGRKRVRDTVLRPVLGREKLNESFSVNEWTWPEIARRYMISVSSLPKMGDVAEDNTEDCLKVLRCIQGDGGVLCGALDGVAGMEVDAQLLAEAEKELSIGSRENEDSQIPNTPQVGTGKDINDGGKGKDGSDETSNWVKLLDPIAKLPTNVGSRIRNRVRDSLEAGPPDWAAQMLELSISKEVYKGNASGPTKRIVMDVLSRVRGEDPKVKKTKKQRKRVVPSPEVVMQRCRIVLRQVAGADKGRIVSTGIGTIITNFYESEGEGVLARPLDFRAIDLRLGAGAYGTAPAAFAADVRQIWKNVASVYGNDSEEYEAITVLSELFESLYSKQVVVFQGGVESTAASAVDGKNTGISGEGASQNPLAGEQPAGQDAGENVKAPWEDDSCRICGIDDDHDNVLLCDGCDAEYHIYCLNPPLQEVPEGNWYCSSCVAVDKGFLEAPSAAEAVTEITKAQEKQDEEQVQRKGEGSGDDVPDKEQRQSGGGLPEDLAWRDLVMKLGETDYWHLSLAERVCLLRFLCDQALDTLKVRIHIEQTMDVAVEHQNKLRHLLAERRRNAELDEAMNNSKESKNAFAVLQAGAAKMKRLYPELVNNPIATEFDHPSQQKLTGEMIGIVDKEQRGLPGLDQVLPSVGAAALKGSFQDPFNRNSGFDTMEIDSTAYHPESREGLEGSAEKPIEILDDSDKPLAEACMPMNDTQRGGVEHTSMSCHREEPGRVPLALNINAQQGLEAEVGGKVALPRGLTSPLDAEIAKAVAKLKCVNIRRDLLGRDDYGRGYWKLFGSTGTPWLAVEVDPEEKLGNAPFSPRSLGNLDNDDNGINPSGQNHHTEGAVGSLGGEEAQKKPQDEYRWFVYSSGEVFDQLIGWLSPSSPQEKTLKASLLQLRGFLLIHEGGVEGEHLEGSLKGLTTKPDLGSCSILRATKLLEWKYGPFGSSTSKSPCPPAPPKRGRKKKTQPMAELSRCKCLEPVWVSRSHCPLCHVTFDSAADMELHSKGVSCISGEENTARHEAGKKTGKKRSQAGKGWETSSPDNLSAIIAQPPDPSTMPFIVRESNKDRVNRIGLIKDKGPTFAPGLPVSPVFDPSLTIMDPFGDWSLSTDEGASGGGQQLLDTIPVGGTSCIRHRDDENLTLMLIKSSEDLPGVEDGAATTLQDTPGASISEAQALQNVDDPSASGAPQFLGNSGLPLPGKSKSGGRLFQVTGKQLKISEASLLPLEDKDIDLLMQLKMHLLDIEAVLSSDMIETGRGSSTRRQAWRSLVKSAQSIYRMVQATILLEQMVCADFLRNSWGYWSSFSAAAKTATISSLFLRVYALDAAILYENSEGYTGPEMSLGETRRGKRERAKDEKNKPNEALRSATKKRRKDDGAS